MSYINTILFAIGLCAIQTACTVDNDRAGDTKYSTDHVLVDAHGLTLKPSKDMYIEFEVISRLYIDTMACMGMTAAGPTIQYKSFSFAGLGGAWGFYHPIAKTIWINTDEDDIVLERDARTDTEALRHEFVHHILHQNNASEDSRGHSTPLLKKCGLGVRTYN